VKQTNFDAAFRQAASRLRWIRSRTALREVTGPGEALRSSGSIQPLNQPFVHGHVQPHCTAQHADRHKNLPDNQLVQPGKSGNTTPTPVSARSRMAG
jgi:hypothetical protein